MWVYCTDAMACADAVLFLSVTLLHLQSANERRSVKEVGLLH
jgi:hypothetical protein